MAFQRKINRNGTSRGGTPGSPTKTFFGAPGNRRKSKRSYMGTPKRSAAQ